MSIKLKEWLGVLLLDTWRYEKALRSTGKEWLQLCNRNESLVSSPDGRGAGCDWRWSSPLHAPGFVKSWGKRLLSRALSEYPLDLGDELIGSKSAEPRISFIIGHRGMERLPHLNLTIRSIANQKEVPIECIIVEESEKSELQGRIPSWVKYIHLPAGKKQPYNRSRTFNAGARIAEGNILVFHDNDMLLPVVYAAELLKKFIAGFQVVNLKRFIFYLTRQHTDHVFANESITMEPPECILQNLTGGGSLAVEKKAYFAIGGFDEGFVGWGGEDVEFWERAQTLKVYNFHHLPLIHLWHSSQPEKTADKNSQAMNRWRELSDIDVNERIRRLTEGE